MNHANNKIGLQLGFLAGFSAFMVCIWMLPVLLAGFPFVLSGTVLDAKEFTQTGLVGGMMPMATLIMGALSPYVGWENAVGWSGLSAIAMALSLFPLWWSVRSLFDVRTAWFTVVIFSFMPITWIHAVRGGGYAFAFLFLFVAFALFIKLYSTRRMLAICLAGVFYGFTLASHHAFITFLPWLVVAYMWLNRADWKRAVLQAVLFTGISYAALMAPMFPNAMRSGMTLPERIGVFLPAPSEHTTGVGHLYPDYYAYEFLYDEFEEIISQRNAEAHFLTQQQDKYVHWIFNVGDLNIFDGLQNGVWLFANTIPELLVQEYLGGAFLWIFILIGIAYLYRTNRRILILFVGLWFSMEMILRFVLHYGRTHLMDIGWGFALLAAVGAVVLCDAYQKQVKISSFKICSIILAFILALQLAQANRKLFAHKYSRSTVPQSYAAAALLNTLPEHAVVAHPRKAYLFYFTDTAHVPLHTETIDFLEERGRVREPLEHFSVTHIIGYNEQRTAAIKRALPSIKVLTPSQEDFSVPITPVIRYLLHSIR